MSRSTRSSRLLAACATAAMLVLASCGGSDDTTSGGGSPGTGGGTETSSGSDAPAVIDGPFVQAVPTDANSFDPSQCTITPCHETVHNLYERLLAFKWVEGDDGRLTYDGLGVEPELAVSWEIDGPTITYKLREGVTFPQTGNPFTAEDVRYSFERLAETVGNGNFQAGVAGIFTPDQMTVIDDFTIAIEHRNPAGEPTAVPVALPSMRFTQFGIVDSVEVKKHATPADPYATEFLKTTPAGTGPYTMVSHTPNEQIVFKAAPNHWSGQQPAFEDIVYRITGGADLVSLLKSGAVHFASEGLTGRQYEELESSGFKLWSAPTPVTLTLQMAMDEAPLTDPAVRQALMHAIPYDQIISTALGGTGQRAVSLYNPADPLGIDNWEVLDFDPDKAADLLAEAGVDDLSVDFWYSADVPYNEDVVLLITNAMADAGVTINPMPRPGLQLAELVRNRAQKKETEMTGMYMTQSVIWLDDPETRTDVSIKSDATSNWAHFDDPEIDRLHREYRHSSDATARAEAYKTIQELAFDHAGFHQLITLGQNIVTVPGLKGITFIPGPYAKWRYMAPAD